MRVLIMGCGRTGSRLATALEEQHHEVTVLDITSSAFRRLPSGFAGRRVTGNGMDRAALEAAGIERADVFIATTQGDNRNIFASELARVVFRVPRVICRLYDPDREVIFNELGIETISPTRVMTDLIAARVTGGS